MHLALALIALQLVVRGLVRVAAIHRDDLILTGRSGSMSLLSRQILFDDHDGHFMPAAFLVAGIATRSRRTTGWWRADAARAPGAVVVARATAPADPRSPPGHPDPVGALSLLAADPPAFAWWAAGLNASPLHIGLAWVAGDAIRLCRTGSPRYAISGFLVFAVSLQFFEGVLSRLPLPRSR